MAVPLPGVGIDSLLHQLAIQALHSVAKVVAMFQLPLLIPIYRFYIGFYGFLWFLVKMNIIKMLFLTLLKINSQSGLGHLSFNTKETVISWPIRKGAIRRGTRPFFLTIGSLHIIILTDISL